MAEPLPFVIGPDRNLHFSSHRVAQLLTVLEVMAAGDTDKRLPLSEARDELDAVAHGINVLVGELGWSSARAIEAQEARAAELQQAVANAERANAAKNVFLRNVSHEIRTPIAAILGLANLLSSPDLRPADRADLVRRLQTNGQAILSLLGDLLDLARLDADRISLAPEPVSVLELVREVLISLEVEAHAKGLQLRLEVASDALGVILTDRHRLRQILVNLVVNAVKFTERGSVVVSLRVTHAPDGDQWTIDVEDTGIGIAADRHPSLFEPFEQADSTIARIYGGTGLGLSLSRRLAQRLGGTLVLWRSAPGQGSTFRLTVRTMPGARQSESAPASEAPLASPHPIDGFRVLLAEDHVDMQLAVRRLLEYAGARVETAVDGREAVAKAMSSTFDVVLMDLRMPHVDGIQATRTLRERGNVVPIVALTADPASLPRAQALDLGFNDCLSKPFTTEALLASIRLVQHSQSG